MTKLNFIYIIALLFCSSAQAEDLESYKWVNRVIVVFADTPNDPAFERQIGLLNEGADGLIERDVIVLTDTTPDVESDLRTRLRPKGFNVVLIGKDGMVKLRKPFPWTVREFSRAIDKMPMRLQELRSQR